VGTEVWRYVAHVGRGEYGEAYKVIRQANPFPSTCARVCDHPCEQVCRAGSTGGEPIALRALKRFAVDHVDPGVYQAALKPAAADARRVAIVGAGPAGLSAAHYLSLQGHRVVVFEREKVPGGMLVCGIPAYRLPREILRREIEALLNENIELRCNAALGRDFTLDGLFAEGYQAVYLALGAHRSRGLGLPGERAEGVHQGMAFLKAYNLEGRRLARGRVGVVGGGNSAMDAARVALRQEGVSGVTLFYRRTRNEMPAFAEEVEACAEEGIEIRTLVSPSRLLAEAGRLIGAEFVHNRLGPPDASGRQRPVPVSGSEEVVALDTLIAAIGEEPDTALLEGMALSAGGGLVADAESGATGRPGVFAGGDLVSGPNTVIAAIAAGKRAAAAIGRYLNGRPLKVLPRVKLPAVYVEPVASGGELAARPASPRLEAGRRCRGFAEVELCLPEDSALGEARRCLRCDLEFTRPLEPAGANGRGR
jgi:NADH-quinone oxidoreductase subunit F